MNSNYLQYGLLFLRVSIGASMMVHGFPKMFNPEMWPMVGQSMGLLGITFMPAAWGFMAALTEFLGGFLIIIGLGTRITSVLMAFTMMVATVVHLAKGDGYNGASHALEIGFVFVSLILMGPGIFSVDNKICKNC